MEALGRILCVCNDINKSQKVVDKAAKIAKEHDTTLTFLFVVEKSLFELPAYGTDETNPQSIKHMLEAQLEATGLEDTVVFVYENDTIGRVMLELEREQCGLVITPYEEERTKALVLALKTPILVLKEAKETYENILVALDNTRVEEYCLPLVQNLFKSSKFHLLQDAQYFFYPLTDPFLSSGMIPYDTIQEMVEEEEIVASQKSHFEYFCNTHNLEGTFKLGTQNIDDDLLDMAKQHASDLLVILPTDETLLDMAIKNILSASHLDILICKQK